MLFQSVISNWTNELGREKSFPTARHCVHVPIEGWKSKSVKKPNWKGGFFVSTENVVLPSGVKVKPDIYRISWPISQSRLEANREPKS